MKTIKLIILWISIFLLWATNFYLLSSGVWDVNNEWLSTVLLLFMAIMIFVIIGIGLAITEVINGDN